MVELSIIIPSFNTKDITRECLESLQKSVKGVNCEIIVVDNASNDGSDEMLKNYETAHFKLIENKKNLGFGRANNQGAISARGTYLLFLNSDVIVDNVDFHDLLAYLNEHKEMGGLTVKVLLPNGKIDPASHRGFPTIWNSLCYFGKLEALFGHLPFINRLVGGYHLTFHNLNTIHEIDSPTGAFFLVKREAFQQIQGFDESYFMYGEDIDLAYRLKQKGYKIIYYPRFNVLHLKYASGLKVEDQEIRYKTKLYFYEAMKIFYQKHYEKLHNSIVNKLVYFFINLKENV